MLALSDAHEAMQISLRRFAQRELRWRARRLDTAASDAIAWEFLRCSCDLGLLSAPLPEPYGGSMDLIGTAIVAEELARWEAGMATLLSANTLTHTALRLSGNHTAMALVFPAVAAAEAQQQPLLCALALSERRLGSDLQHTNAPLPGRMMVTAKRRGATYVLSGRKAYCAAGNMATWLCVFATVSDDRSPVGLTGFIIPTSAKGFHVSAVLPTMGLRACPLVEFYLEHVEVPQEHLLTAEGEAFSLLAHLEAHERCHAAAIAVGIARGAFEQARVYTIGRVQGGTTIAQHQIVQHQLADMATQIEAARLLTYKAASADPPQVALSSMAKVFASDVAVHVTTAAVQLLGAYGTTTRSGIEKYFRDAKMTQIFAATNEICRLAIAAPLIESAGLLTQRE